MPPELGVAPPPRNDSLPARHAIHDTEARIAHMRSWTAEQHRYRHGVAGFTQDEDGSDVPRWLTDPAEIADLIEAGYEVSKPKEMLQDHLGVAVTHPDCDPLCRAAALAWPRYRELQ